MVSEARRRASAKYRKTARGKASQARATAKSSGKRFIKRYATLDELAEYETLIKAKRQELTK